MGKLSHSGHIPHHLDLNPVMVTAKAQPPPLQPQQYPCPCMDSWLTKRKKERSPPYHPLPQRTAVALRELTVTRKT